MRGLLSVRLKEVIADAYGSAENVYEMPCGDARQHASEDGVWAAGDCADTYDLVARRRVHVALGTVANRTARVAGINVEAPRSAWAPIGAAH